MGDKNPKKREKKKKQVNKQNQKWQALFLLLLNPEYQNR